MVDAEIFKAYDVRGIYGTQIDEALAEMIGQAFAALLDRTERDHNQPLRVSVGHDMRHSSPSLAARYCEGLRDGGADVIDIGEVATEMLYYTVGSRGLDGGLMCTASHNPKAWTGAKLVKRGAVPLSGDAGMDELERLVLGGPPAKKARGGHERLEIGEEYREAIKRFVDPEAIGRLKVVLDGGNGMASTMVGPVLDTLAIEQVPTYWQPDGDFPDHEPNPLLAENRRFIIDRVLSEGADLGIAWDGDADRCFFIDDQGSFVDGDFLTALLAQSILIKEPGATILYDVRASRAVPDVVAAADGSSYINRVGHAFFKSRMRAEGASFGGEVSGHYYFRDFYCADSGAIPALLVLELICTSGRSLSELLEPFRTSYHISGEINSEVADQSQKMKELADRYRDATVTWLDGVSVDYPSWHFNVRPSNTEPLLRLNLESLVSREHMEEKRDEVLAIIRR